MDKTTKKELINWFEAFFGNLKAQIEGSNLSIEKTRTGQLMVSYPDFNQRCFCVNALLDGGFLDISEQFLKTVVFESKFFN